MQPKLSMEACDYPHSRCRYKKLHFSCLFKRDKEKSSQLKSCIANLIPPPREFFHIDLQGWLLESADPRDWFFHINLLYKEWNRVKRSSLHTKFNFPGSPDWSSRVSGLKKGHLPGWILLIGRINKMIRNTNRKNTAIAIHHWKTAATLKIDGWLATLNYRRSHH
jgi:hypothetical protein